MHSRIKQLFTISFLFALSLSIVSCFPEDAKIEQIQVAETVIQANSPTIKVHSERKSKLPLDSITLPEGFYIDVYAENVPNARSMVLSPDGTLFVGNKDGSVVYAVIDRDKDNYADEVIGVTEGLRSPNGVAFKDGALYVATLNTILKYENIERDLYNPPEPIVLNDSLPTETHHGWKYLGFGPDGLLYFQIGAPCNICEKDDERFATIMRMQPDGTQLEVYASGVRNSVGFDWHPENGELWFTDNGRDWMGDDIPPDELNRIPEKGLHFGFPYCHGNGIIDPDFGAGKDCSDYVAPVQELGPHVAALGMQFYTGTMFPEKYHNQIFIAEHGSWNRKDKIGYRITLATLAGNEVVNYEVFAEGWLQGQQEWGRPVDVLVMPDGALLVSDDSADAIYRISYHQS